MGNKEVLVNLSNVLKKLAELKEKIIEIERLESDEENLEQRNNRVKNALVIEKEFHKLTQDLKYLDINKLISPEHIFSKMFYMFSTNNEGKDTELIKAKTAKKEILIAPYKNRMSLMEIISLTGLHRNTILYNLLILEKDRWIYKYTIEGKQGSPVEFELNRIKFIRQQINWAIHRITKFKEIFDELPKTEISTELKVHLQILRHSKELLNTVDTKEPISETNLQYLLQKNSQELRKEITVPITTNLETEMRLALNRLVEYGLVENYCKITQKGKVLLKELEKNNHNKE